MERTAALAAELRAEIAAHGPLPFARFMAAALYHPLHGYYRQADRKIGRQGDFYTNVSVGPLFGRLLGLQFAEMWERLGSPAEIAWIEQGAHQGLFLHDFLAWTRAERPDFHAALRPVLIEPSEVLRGLQRETLGPEAARTCWIISAAELAQPFAHALFFSNELIDAFPVHRITRAAAGWRESHVAWRDGAFAWEELPPASPGLAEAAAALDPALPVGYVTEINLAARAWIGEVASLFEQGYILTVDYGHAAADYYAPERNEGTLLCYRAHRRSADPLAEPGVQDITAHVDFTALAVAGRAAGLEPLGFTDQHHFLVGLAQAFPQTLAAVLAEETGRRAFKALMHPEVMGTTFRYLVQGKSVPEAPLAGLAFARPNALG
jgi:SAM-dependent MidA family methyltransferase